MQSELEAALNEFRGGHNTVDLSVSHLEDLEDVYLEVKDSGEGSSEYSYESMRKTSQRTGADAAGSTSRQTAHPGDSRELLQKLAETEAEKAQVTDGSDLLYAELETLRAGQKGKGRAKQSQNVHETPVRDGAEAEAQTDLEQADAKKQA